MSTVPNIMAKAPYTFAEDMTDERQAEALKITKEALSSRTIRIIAATRNTAPLRSTYARVSTLRTDEGGAASSARVSEAS